MNYDGGIDSLQSVGFWASFGLICGVLTGELAAAEESILPLTPAVSIQNDGKSGGAFPNSTSYRSRIWDGDYINGVVAVVNDRVITAGELRQEMLPVISRLQMESPLEKDFAEQAEILAKEVLDQLIDRLLVIQEFYRRGYQVPKSHKNSQFNEFIQTQFNGDRLKFTEQLHEYGKSLQQFKREMEENFIVDVMLHRVRQSRSQISPSAIQRYYDSHHEEFFQPESVRLSQIYFQMREMPPAENETLLTTAKMLAGNGDLREALGQLEAGEAFSSLAQRFGGSNGDDWFAIGDLRPEIAAGIQNIETDQWVGPIALGDRVALVSVLERRESHYETVQEVQDSIETRLLQERIKEAQDSWIQQLRRNAYIRIYL